jgi:hypothetical protein
MGSAKILRAQDRSFSSRTISRRRIGGIHDDFGRLNNDRVLRYNDFIEADKPGLRR